MFLCGFVGGCSANASGSLSPQAAEASAGVTTPIQDGNPSTDVGGVRLKPDACAEDDLTPEHQHLSISALQEHLAARGLAYEISAERGDLHLFDVEYRGHTTELRVATLKEPQEAGRYLHEALLEHGRGYWGVHRGNLAVLGPPGSPAEALGFAVDTGLACWGVLTLAGRDDSFVVPGGYFEL